MSPLHVSAAADPTAEDLSEFEGGEFVPTDDRDEPKRRSSVFSVRFTGEELDSIVAAAKVAGVKPSAFIRQAALAALDPNTDQVAEMDRRCVSLLRQVATLIEADIPGSRWAAPEAGPIVQLLNIHGKARAGYEH